MSPRLLSDFRLLLSQLVSGSLQFRSFCLVSCLSVVVEGGWLLAC